MLLSGGGTQYCTRVDSAQTYYVVSQGKVWAEYFNFNVNSAKFRYIYAGDERIAMRDISSRLHYYLNDHLGSARVVCDTAGVIKDKYTYKPFGNEGTGQTISTNQPNRYTGKPYDSDGGLNLFYYGARYYDPVIGRFTQVDPLAKEYPAWGAYVYALDNPVRYVDPDGNSVAAAAQHVMKAAAPAMLVPGAGKVAAVVVAVAAIVYVGAEIADNISSTSGTDVSTGTTSFDSAPDEAGDGAMQSRADNKIGPDPKAEGSHSTIKRDPKTGEITNTAEYEPNSKNPKGWDEVKRVDVKGKAHNKVPTPHVREKGSKQPRPARADELPRHQKGPEK